ncbi:hypothetical protein PoB_000269400 [Plakobranchus ocellatus]|uniref:Uncharacterized protein n=1 Tax=Plakobranchus ocellatus TaxID=259542 RepID=A0AAV3Y1S3_9GAST|nr:hypothetical protein PoB_000269400 [Plakobranchus ocellatus]
MTGKTQVFFQLLVESSSNRCATMRALQTEYLEWLPFAFVSHFARLCDQRSVGWPRQKVWALRRTPRAFLHVASLVPGVLLFWGETPPPDPQILHD